MAGGEEFADLLAEGLVALRAAVDEGGVARFVEHALGGGEELLARLGFGVGDAAAERDGGLVGGGLLAGEAPIGGGAGGEEADGFGNEVSGRAVLPGVAGDAGGGVEVGGRRGGFGGEGHGCRPFGQRWRFGDRVRGAGRYDPP